MPEVTTSRGRVLVDGTDAGTPDGVPLVARQLRDHGFEVVATGPACRVEVVVATARDEDVDLVWLIGAAGSPRSRAAEVLAGLRAAGLDTPVLLAATPAPDSRWDGDDADLVEFVDPSAPAYDVVAAVERRCARGSAER